VGTKSFPINDATTTRFHALATADPGPEGEAILSIFRATQWPRPVAIRMLERHPLGTQAFFPLSPEDWLVVVAAGERPGADDLRLFRAGGDQGVQYGRGIWHHPLLVLAEQQDFLVVDRQGPGDNLNQIEVEPGAVIDSTAEPTEPAGRQPGNPTQAALSSTPTAPAAPARSTGSRPTAPAGAAGSGRCANIASGAR
jgi:ureidoglycolate lyase